jgi:hypothetical protein
LEKKRKPLNSESLKRIKRLVRNLPGHLNSLYQLFLWTPDVNLRRIMKNPPSNLLKPPLLPFHTISVNVTE